MLATNLNTGDFLSHMRQRESGIPELENRVKKPSYGL